MRNLLSIPVLVLVATALFAQAQVPPDHGQGVPQKESPEAAMAMSLPIGDSPLTRVVAERDGVTETVTLPDRDEAYVHVRVTNYIKYLAAPKTVAHLVVACDSLRSEEKCFGLKAGQVYVAEFDFKHKRADLPWQYAGNPNPTKMFRSRIVKTTFEEK